MEVPLPARCRRANFENEASASRHDQRPRASLLAGRPLGVAEHLVSTVAEEARPDGTRHAVPALLMGFFENATVRSSVIPPLDRQSPGGGTAGGFHLVSCLPVVQPPRNRDTRPAPGQR